MEEAPENGKESSHSAHGDGMNEYIKLHNREEWKKLPRTARNRHIVHMPMEWMNEKWFSIEVEHNEIAADGFSPNRFQMPIAVTEVFWELSTVVIYVSLL